MRLKKNINWINIPILVTSLNLKENNLLMKFIMKYMIIKIIKPHTKNLLIIKKITLKMK